MNFPSQIFYNDINHGYRAAILKKKNFVDAFILNGCDTYFYYEKVRRTMRTAIVSSIIKVGSHLEIRRGKRRSEINNKERLRISASFWPINF